MLTDFNRLGISAEMEAVLRHQGIVEPTPVQEAAIPLILASKDVIAQAQTGTGKTFAFMLPILEKLDVQNGDVQALIVTPTRELAIQITAEARKLAAGKKGVAILAAYGGQDVEQQLRKLQGGCHIVIGTPGRLLDHLRRGTLKLNKVSSLVLDEADQMLHMGFLDEVEAIIAATPSSRGTLLFSATMPPAVRNLAKSYMRSPEEIIIQSHSQETLKSIRQIVVEVTDRTKQQALVSMMEQHQPYLAVIFCRTKRRAHDLNEALQKLGYMSDELHGDLTQAKREKVMRDFRSAKLQFLVATDVAARGLDVEGVTHVFNYDIPADVESYIHRIGRTGRAGNKGVAITFAAPKDRNQLQMIERGIRQTLERRDWKTGEQKSEPKKGAPVTDQGGERGRGQNQSKSHKPSGSGRQKSNDSRRGSDRSTQANQSGNRRGSKSDAWSRNRNNSRRSR